MADPTTTASTERMTFEEAARLDPDTHAGELDRGRFIAVTKGTWRHGQIVGNVVVVLRSYARTHAGWSVAAGDPGTKLARNPDTLRGPDVAIVRAERLPTGKGAAGWLEGGPDVAVEVIGDAQSMSSLMKKGLEYLAAGSKMVWILDDDEQQVVLLEPPDRVRVLGPGDALDGGEALPGFRCTVAELFE